MLLLPSLSLAVMSLGIAPEVMPRDADYTLMWWAEGFPGSVPQAPWLRCVQTGSYAVAMETETLRLAHFGPVASGLGYRAAALADNEVWRRLPPAELDVRITVDGRSYRGRGGRWSQFGGPRLIESGRFFQRGDITDLVFTADDGARLNVEARFETAAWPDRLALLLAARPGRLPLPAGEPCFGRVGGGYGLAGSNHLEVPHAPELEPEQLTLELWAFVPTDAQVSPRTSPWLVCKSGNEWVDGNYGLMLIGGRPRACLNIGGGRENAFTVDAAGGHPVKYEAWNHLALSYDGQTLRLFVNGRPAGEQTVGRRRSLGRGPLAFGRRQDNSGDGYYFRGVIDEVRVYDRALAPAEVAARASAPEEPPAGAAPVRAWSFDPAGQAAATRPQQQWHNAAMELTLTTAEGVRRTRWELPPGEIWTGDTWREVALEATPGSPPEPPGELLVSAAELPSGKPRPVAHDAARGWYRVNLDQVEPVVPEGGRERQNDAVERVRLTLTNPTDRERVARLMLEKTAGGFGVKLGAPITGMSAYLLDAAGQPVGLPVQLSKNWHGRPEGGVHAGLWFHGFTQVRLPAGETVELELNVVYGHHGGVPAASHAQLCLVGWGSNQLWDQSALGAWGESICYEPDQAQAQAAVLDVRPLMVRGMHANQQWGWTHNVGGGDFFRYHDPAGERVKPVRMKTAYLRQCPVLTEVVYAGRSADGRIAHDATVSLARSDDLVRGIYRLRMEVNAVTPFSRFVICQIGADSYSYTGERLMAVGNEIGLLREWPTQWGGGTYRTEPMECPGRVPWVSLHEAVSRAANGVGAWANRGLVVREWRARLGGRPAGVWLAEYGVKARGTDTSTIDLVPPPGVSELLPGDFVEATIEHLVVPQFAADYYGPNENLRAALARDGNTWRMVHREAVGNDVLIEASVGRVERQRPLLIRVEQDRAEFTVAGGLGYLPVTIAGLARPGAAVVEEHHDGGWRPAAGSQAWQADWAPGDGTWELTFSLNLDTPGDERRVRDLRVWLRP